MELNELLGCLAIETSPDFTTKEHEHSKDLASTARAMSTHAKGAQQSPHENGQTQSELFSPTHNLATAKGSCIMDKNSEAEVRMLDISSIPPLQLTFRCDAAHLPAGYMNLDLTSLDVPPDLVMSMQRCLLQPSLPDIIRLMDHAKLQDLLHENCNLDVATFKAPGVPHKAAVVEKLAVVGPPPQFRLINLHSTLVQNRVVLVDGHAHQDTYTAISHTWGAEVYAIFDCECACESTACRFPRFSGKKPCPGATAHGPRHGVVVGDILKMCRTCLEAGSEFVWHDGVCIAQHNPAEVEETIRHMGWIYANATDTMIFLDYVGNPVALLRPEAPYKTRWNRRVWTLQEATLSRRRRYCIRRLGKYMYPTPDGFLTTPYSSMAEHYWKRLPHFFKMGNIFYDLVADFEAKLVLCHEDDSCIEVIEEDELWTDLLSLLAHVLFLAEYAGKFSSSMLGSLSDCLKTMKWISAVMAWINHMKEELFRVPKFTIIMANCASQRESKHEGDRINSVLGLAGITDFVAPKDGNLEDSSVQFLKRVKSVCMQEGIREALFWVNSLWEEKDERKMHTWLPCLSRPFFSASGRDHQEIGPAENDDDLVYLTPFTEQVRCAVLENGMLELTGYMLCILVQFTIVNKEDTCNLPSWDPAAGRKTAISMDLCGSSNMVRGGGFDAFAGRSSTKFGNAMVPALYIETTDSISTIEKDQSQVGTFRPRIQGQVMEQGSSFWAYMVFAEFGLDIDDSSRYVAPALLVQASPSLLQQEPVSRLGYFKVSSQFNSFLFGGEQHHFMIRLDQLVIN